jgi:hypothetical protein
MSRNSQVLPSTIIQPGRIEMNQALRWKLFITWWDREFPAQSNLNIKYTTSQVINIIEDKIFELRTGEGDKKKCTPKNN